jgi:hypothetical protein
MHYNRFITHSEELFMIDPIDKARKYIALWTEDAKRLKLMSLVTGRTQVELIHEGLTLLEHHIAMVNISEARGAAQRGDPDV